MLRASSDSAARRVRGVGGEAPLAKDERLDPPQGFAQGASELSDLDRIVLGADSCRQHGWWTVSTVSARWTTGATRRADAEKPTGLPSAH